MAITNNTPLKITENLLKLERGKNELLLSDYLVLQPLYIKKGRSYINDFLKAVADLGTYKKIIEAFPQEAKLLDTLLAHGIIVPQVPPTHKPEKRSSGEPDLDNQRSMSLYLLISQSCNMGCVYCLNGKKTYQSDKNLTMTQETAFKAVDRCLESVVHQGRLEIIFFGGEPLLNWPLAKKIIIYCEDSLKGKHSGKSIIYHFTSNLSFLPKDLIDWAKRYNISFLCDIDGPDKIHNRCRPFKDGRPTHDIIVQNLSKLIQADLKVDLRATVTAMNQDFLLEVTKHHKSLGAKSSAFIPANPINSDEEILAASLLPSAPKVIRGVIKAYLSNVWDQGQLFPFNHYVSRLTPGDGTVFGCGAPYGNTAIVDVKGEVYPCIYLVGIKRYHLGNITDESYLDKNLLSWMRDYLHVDNLEECKSCPWRYICGGGCPLGRLTVFNNPLATSKVLTYCKQITCDYTKKIMEILIWEKAQEAAANILESCKRTEAIAVGPIIHCS